MIKKKLLKLASMLSIGLLCSCGTMNYVRDARPETKKTYVLDDYKEKRKLEKDPKFMAGAYKTKITPQEEVYVAGFMPSKKSKGVHDDLYARCVMLDDGKNTVGLVSLDLIGYFYDDIEKVRKNISEKYDHNIIIASTHTHAGPDTLGYFGKSLFGALPIKSGVDKEYMISLEKKIEKCINKAIENMEYANLEFASIQAPNHISENIRIKDYKDNELTVMKVNSLEGKTIATVVNYAAHPEILGSKNKLISADFVGYLCDNIEKKLGGTAVFFNGALGGMITPDVKNNSFEEVERIGNELAETAFKALENTEVVYDPKIELKQKKFILHVGNWKFNLLKSLKVFKRKDYGKNDLMTEINVINIGPAQFVTMPGEIFPSVGFWIKKHMTGKYKSLIGLGSDELGYIMTKEEFKKKRYKYEQSMSLGKETWPETKKELLILLEN